MSPISVTVAWNTGWSSPLSKSPVTMALRKVLESWEFPQHPELAVLTLIARPSPFWLENSWKSILSWRKPSPMKVKWSAPKRESGSQVMVCPFSAVTLRSRRDMHVYTLSSFKYYNPQLYRKNKFYTIYRIESPCTRTSVCRCQLCVCRSARLFKMPTCSWHFTACCYS